MSFDYVLSQEYLNDLKCLNLEFNIHNTLFLYHLSVLNYNTFGVSEINFSTSYCQEFERMDSINNKWIAKFAKDFINLYGTNNQLLQMNERKRVNIKAKNYLYNYQFSISYKDFLHKYIDENIKHPDDIKKVNQDIQFKCKYKIKNRKDVNQKQKFIDYILNENKALRAYLEYIEIKNNTIKNNNGLKKFKI